MKTRAPSNPWGLVDLGDHRLTLRGFYTLFLRTCFPLKKKNKKIASHWCRSAEYCRLLSLSPSQSSSSCLFFFFFYPSLLQRFKICDPRRSNRKTTARGAKSPPNALWQLCFNHGSSRSIPEKILQKRTCTAKILIAFQLWCFSSDVSAACDNACMPLSAGVHWSSFLFDRRAE